MTQEDKELLLRDLCCRLPYNVKVHAKYTDLGETIELDGIVKMIDADGVVGIEVINDFSSAWTYVQIDNVKPYLFPLSSMTEEQKNEFNTKCLKLQLKVLDDEIMYETATEFEVDFYNKHHLDWRGLIPKGLAVDCTDLNIY